MRAILFLVGGFLLANIVGATFFWHPKAAEPTPAPVVNAATQQGQDPWMVNEKYNVGSREHIRKGVLEALSQPWSSYCTADGRKALVETVNNYFYQRDAQMTTYAKVYGDAAERFAMRAWASTDDNRIQRLMSEHFGRGYFALDELRPYARTPVGELVKGARVTRSCAS